MKKLLLLMLSALMLIMLIGCGGKKNDTLVIYDGQFSEMKIIHNMVKLLVEEDTDLTVEIRDEMAPFSLFTELTQGKSDLMTSYDGTLLTTFLDLDPKNVPAGETLYDFVNQKGKSMKKVMLLDKLGINNTYTIATTQAIADKYKLQTVSDLAKVANELTFGAEHDFFIEEGSAKFYPFSQSYGLKFKDVKQLDISLKYTAVESGNIDVTVVYATDGLNRKSKLKILEDDKNYFPEYNGALLVRTDFFEKFKDTAPNLEQTLAKLKNIFTNDDMTNLTYEVDVNKRNVQDVAKEYLQKKGLIK